MPKRPKKTKPSRLALVPHDAVVLGIDPGETSGWCVLNVGQALKSGIAVTPEQREAVVDYALLVAKNAKHPLLVVAESWAPFVSRILQPAWVAWNNILKARKVSPRRVMRVNVSTWRCDVLKLGKLGTEEAKAAAIAEAEGYLPRAIRPIDPNEAEAACIAHWGGWALKSLERLPKKRAPKGEKLKKLAA